MARVRDGAGSEGVAGRRDGAEALMAEVEGIREKGGSIEGSARGVVVVGAGPSPPLRRAEAGLAETGRHGAVEPERIRFRAIEDRDDPVLRVSESGSSSGRRGRRRSLRTASAGARRSGIDRRRARGVRPVIRVRERTDARGYSRRRRVGGAGRCRSRARSAFPSRPLRFGLEGSRARACRPSGASTGRAEALGVAGRVDGARCAGPVRAAIRRRR